MSEIPKKILIPIIVAAILIICLIGGLVYRSTSSSPFKEEEVQQTIAPTTQAVIETKVAGSNKAPIPELDFETPTIATTEAVVNNETVNIGVVETVEDNSYIGVTPDGEVVASINTIQLDSGHVYTEEEALAVENLSNYWKEHNISKTDLQEQMNDPAFDGLSDQDKQDLVDKISSADPHDIPSETISGIQESSAEPTEQSTMSYEEREAFLNSLGMSSAHVDGFGDLSGLNLNNAQ